MNIDAKNMNVHEHSGVTYLTFPSFEQFSFVRHAFSTRIGGVSENEFTSMNLSFGRGDSDDNVRENYRRLCAAAGFEPESLVASAQDHNTFIRTVTANEQGVGIWRERDMQSVDGLVTNEPGVTLVTYYADCVPLYFLDPVRRVAGLAHAGWRGTVGRIGEKMVQKLVSEFRSSPADILAAIGPSIGPCCYEVDTPVYEQFSALTDLDPSGFTRELGGGKYIVDLWETNRRILLHAGVCPEHIETANLCTRCSSEWLFSHRAAGGKRGGLAAFIELTEAEACPK